MCIRDRFITMGRYNIQKQKVSRKYQNQLWSISIREIRYFLTAVKLKNILLIQTVVNVATGAKIGANLEFQKCYNVSISSRITIADIPKVCLLYTSDAADD